MSNCGCLWRLLTLCHSFKYLWRVGQAPWWGLWEIKEEWGRISALRGSQLRQEKSSNNCNLEQNEVSVSTEAEAARCLAAGVQRKGLRTTSGDVGKGLPAQKGVVRLALLQGPLQPWSLWSQMKAKNKQTNKRPQLTFHILETSTVNAFLFPYQWAEKCLTKTNKWLCFTKEVEGVVLTIEG